MKKKILIGAFLLLVLATAIVFCAAALSVKKSADLRGLKVTELQDELKKLGVDSF